MTISIIIVAHNNIEVSRACLTSLQRHTTIPYELILVDDGSTDRTYDLFRSVTRKAYRIPHGGASRARNEGLKHATGDLIMFLDNDIFVSPLWLWILSLRSSSEGIGIIGGIPSNERHKLKLERSPDGLIDVQEMASAIFGITRSCFNRVGFFDVSLWNAGEDTDYCYRAALAGFRVALCPEVVLRHESGATRKRLDQSRIKQSRRKFYEKWKRYANRFDLVKAFENV